MPLLPRLHMGKPSSAVSTPTSAAAPAGLRVSRSDTGVDVQCTPLQRSTEERSPEQLAVLEGTPGAAHPRGAGQTEATGPYDVGETPQSPSSPAALPMPVECPAVTKAASAAAAPAGQRDSGAPSAPEVLEMRHAEEVAVPSQQAQRQESDESSSLFKMLQLMESMMAWSPTNTDRANSASDQCGTVAERAGGNGEQAGGDMTGAAEDVCDRQDAEAEAAIQDAAGPQHNSHVVSAEEAEDPLVDERSTLAEALPAEPDLAAAPRSSFECSDERCECKQSICMSCVSLPGRDDAP